MSHGQVEQETRKTHVDIRAGVYPGSRTSSHAPLVGGPKGNVPAFDTVRDDARGKPRGRSKIYPALRTRGETCTETMDTAFKHMPPRNHDLTVQINLMFTLAGIIRLG